MAATSAGSAQALDPSYVSYSLQPGVYAPTIDGYAVGSYSASAGGNLAEVRIQTAPVAAVTAHAHSAELTSNTNNYYEPSASASIQYGFSASVGCDANSPCAATPFAPIHLISISGYVGSKVVGAASHANIFIGGDFDPFAYYCTPGASDCGVHPFSVGTTLTGVITPGTNGSYTVDYTSTILLSIDVLANTRVDPGDPAGDAIAYLDPKISFDPDVLAAGGFTAGTITLSPGVANASAPPTGFGGAVPEPASWALLIAGFGLTGIAMRRRGAVRTA